MTIDRDNLNLNKFYTITYQDFMQASTSGDFVFIKLPAGTVIDHTLVKPTESFKDLKDATFADGVTNTDTSLVSATAVFVAGDVGKTVTGAGIQAGTTIASRTNGTTVVLSKATTATATGVTFTIVARAHGVTAVTARVITSDHNFGTAFDVFQAPGDTVLDSDLVRFRESFVAETDLKLHLVATGGNLSTLTSGAVNVIVGRFAEGVDTSLGN